MENLNKAVEAMNQALKDDPEAIQKLLDFRVPCNEKLANHPTVQVRQEADGTFSVGALGLLNGVLGESQGRLAITLPDEGEEIQGFIALD
jgi:hypothetical protein